MHTGTKAYPEAHTNPEQHGSNKHSSLYTAHSNKSVGAGVDVLVDDVAVDSVAGAEDAEDVEVVEDGVLSVV